MSTSSLKIENQLHPPLQLFQCTRHQLTEAPFSCLNRNHHVVFVCFFFWTTQMKLIEFNWIDLKRLPSFGGNVDRPGTDGPWNDTSRGHVEFRCPFCSSGGLRVAATPQWQLHWRVNFTGGCHIFSAFCFLCFPLSVLEQRRTASTPSTSTTTATTPTTKISNDELNIDWPGHGRLRL